MKKQIFHPYHLWEDYKAGFYDNISGKNKSEMINKVVEMFSSSDLTSEYMEKVITEWKYSCEHNLTNMALNRIAYLGQAACCIYANIPNSITMEAWSKVEKIHRDNADKIATEKIQKWETKNKNIQLCLKFI
jgi:hypothetical protein